MKTFSFLMNKANWSGENAQIQGEEFAGGFKWEQYGYTVELRDRERFDGEEAEADDGWGWTQYTIYVDGRATDNKVGKFDKDDMWEATDWCGDMTRQASDLACAGYGQVGAAAQLMFNLL